MLKNLVVAILLLIFCHKIAAQNSSNNDLQLALLSLGKAKKDTNGVKRLLQLGNLHYDKIHKDASSKDSALLYASAAETLSNQLSYNTGLEKSYLAQIKIALKLRELLLNEGKKDVEYISTVKKYQQKLISLSENKGKPEVMAELYQTMAVLYSENEDDARESIKLIEQSLNIAKKHQLKLAEAKGLFKLGDKYMSLSDLENAEKYISLSIQKYKAIGKKDIQKEHSTLGIVYTYLGNFPLGLEHGLESEKLAETYKDTSDFMSSLYGYIAVTYEATKDWNNALLYYKKALREAEKHDDNSMISTIASNIAKIMSFKGDAKGSLAFMEGIVKKYPLPPTDESNIRIKIRFMVDYLRLKDTVQSQKYCDSLLALSNKMPETWRYQMVIFSPVIKHLINTKQFDEALKYLPHYQRSAEKAGIPSFSKEVQMRWYQIDSARGDFISAIKHYKRFYNINDSLFSVGKAKEFGELRIKYETEKKDNELRLRQQDILLLTREAALRERGFEKDRMQFQFDSLSKEQTLQLFRADASKKDNDLLLKQQDIRLLKNASLLQEAKLNQTKTSRNVIIGGAAMLLLLLTVMYNRYLVKQKANKLINEKNLALQQAVNEKEWLLKEIHHRVKNNLQTVVSLLESQSAYLQSDALLAIQDSQNRVHAMSLVHQKLYQAENVASINMAAYLPELVNYLRDGFNVKQQIRFQLEIDPVELDVSQAIPIGLILNEAITNSIKYAFPENISQPLICISMQQGTDNKIDLVITDNGKGLPADFKTGSNSGLGLKLMKGLTEDINGNFSISNQDGTSIAICFTANTLLHKAKEIDFSKPWSQTA